ITDDLDVLLAFYDYPAEHWVHLRTTTPIESTFSTVRLRQRGTKGPGSRAAGIAMAFKLIQSAQTKWRAVNAPHLVALVRAGATFVKETLIYCRARAPVAGRIGGCLDLMRSSRVSPMWSTGIVAGGRAGMSFWR